LLTSLSNQPQTLGRLWTQTKNTYIMISFHKSMVKKDFCIAEVEFFMSRMEGMILTCVHITQTNRLSVRLYTRGVYRSFQLFSMSLKPDMQRRK
jgi:hypothetical protein